MKHLFVVLSFLLLSNGLVSNSFAQKNNKAKDFAYSEDLSPTRPRYNPFDTRPQEETKDLKVDKAQTVKGTIKPAVDGSLRSIYSADDTLALKFDSLATINKKILYTKGYRIQLYNGSNKDAITQIKTKVYTRLPDIDIYTTFWQPNYKVKAGDFMSKIEAYQALGELLKDFPTALIVPDEINLKK
jgi:hypothetical protein